MTIMLTLTPEQEAWIAGAISRGEFGSEEEAARAAFGLGVLQLDYAGAEEDEAESTRIRHLLDEAREQVARGDYVTLNELRARMAARRKQRGVT